MELFEASIKTLLYVRDLAKVLAQGNDKSNPSK